MWYKLWDSVKSITKDYFGKSKEQEHNTQQFSNEKLADGRSRFYKKRGVWIDRLNSITKKDNK